MTKRCTKCHTEITDEEYERNEGLCDGCDAVTVRERSPGLEMTRRDWENFMESE